MASNSKNPGPKNPQKQGKNARPPGKNNKSPLLPGGPGFTGNLISTILIFLVLIVCIQHAE